MSKFPLALLLILSIAINGNSQTNDSHRVLVLLVNHIENDNPDPTSVALFEDLIFNENCPNSLHSLYQEMSYGNATLTGDVHGWVYIEHDPAWGTNPSDCQPISLWQPIWDLDAAGDINIADYDDILMIRRKSDDQSFNCGASAQTGNPSVDVNGEILNFGRGQIGIRPDFISEYLSNPSCDSYPFWFGANHETLHLFSLSHPNTIHCAECIIPALSDSPPNYTCEVMFSRNVFDIMGGDHGVYHINPFYKDNLEWFSSNQLLIDDVEDDIDGCYNLTPYEINTDDLKSILVPLSNPISLQFSTEYEIDIEIDQLYLEYRTFTGFDSGIYEDNPNVNTNGIIVNLVGTTNANAPTTTTVLLHPNATSQNQDYQFDGAFLFENQILNIPGNNISIEVNNISPGQFANVVIREHPENFALGECSNIVEMMTTDEPDCNNEPCLCEDEGFDINAGEGTNYSDIDIPFDISNRCISISGKLIIDDNVEWTEVDVRMHPGAEIEMLGIDELKFEIYNSVLRGCDQMWKGIIVNGEAEIIVEDTEIRDAQYAITAGDDARIHLLRNTFDRNFVGVYTAPSPGDLQFFKPENGSIDWDDNTFKCDGNLLPAYPGQDPAPGNTSYAGIWWNDVHTIYVFEEGENNYFEGSLFGIIINRADNVAIRSVHIKDLVLESDIYGDGNVAIKLTDGVDIKMRDLQLGNCSVSLDQEPCDENLRIGVEGSNIDGYIRVSEISSTEIGVVMSNGEGVDTQIGRIVDSQPEGNTISSKIGIQFNNYNNPRNKDITIRSNRIKAQQAIEINAVNYTVFVRDNVTNTDLSIWPDNAAGGLSLLDSDGEITVKDNYFNFMNFPGDFFVGNGISLENTQRCFFERNVVTGPSNLNLLSGIYAVLSPNNTYCCNKVLSTHYGVQFEGDCSPSNLNNTTFGDHVIGLLLSTDAKIGEQLYNGNSWEEANCSLYDASFEGATGTADSSFFTSSPSLIPNEYTAINVNGGTATDWFLLDKGDDSSCSKDCDNDLPWEEFPGRRNTQLEQTISDQSIDATEVKVYPNPTKNFLSLEFNEELLSDAQFNLFDVNGKLVFTQNLPAGTTKYRLDEFQLSTGIYFFKIENLNKEVLTSGKVVIAK